MNVQNSDKIQGIQVISRAAAVLRLLGRETEGLSLGQIASRVNLPRSTVQRIVGALATEGFISTGEGSGRIKLGPEIQSLGLSLTIDPIERLKPMMQALADKTGETVDLAVLRNQKMLFVDQIVGQHRLRTVSSIGESFPLTTTANGKAALARLDEVDASQLIIRELRATGAKNLKISALLSEIEGIRDGALASDSDEHTDGISALGFGISDPGGEIFAVSVPVPSSRFARIKPQLVEALQDARAKLDAL